MVMSSRINETTNKPVKGLRVTHVRSGHKKGQTNPILQVQHFSLFESCSEK